MNKGEKRKKSSLLLRKERKGYWFILPWFVGFVLFFMKPLVEAVIMSLQSFDRMTLERAFIGFDNFVFAFRSDAQFPRLLWNSLISNLLRLPFILIFSYFVALLLKKPFKGSFLVKSIFFLTVIMSSDMYIRMQVQTYTSVYWATQTLAADAGTLFQTVELLSIREYLLTAGLPYYLVDFLQDGINNISNIMIYSGIQIFIFLAGIHSIPDSMYEAAHIEGASAWESFWKITFPLTTPVILVCVVYSIIDCFSMYVDTTLQYIYRMGFELFNYGYSSALALIYFGIVGILLIFVFLFMRRRVFYFNV